MASLDLQIRVVDRSRAASLKFGLVIEQALCEPTFSQLNSGTVGVQVFTTFIGKVR